MLDRLNLHIDESGTQDLAEGIHLISVVMHNHDNDISDQIRRYEERLEVAGLENIPFHGKDLLHGNEKYSSISVGDRKRLLTQFARLVRSLPFSYFTLCYSARDIHGQRELESRIRRDLAAVAFEHLEYFQQFRSIAVYYDDGQKAVSTALHDSLDFVLARNVADYRDADHKARRLLQVADYVCTIERVGVAYNSGSQTKTHERFFGSRRDFMQSFRKQLTRKQFV